jgi:hypothetical protein
VVIERAVRAFVDDVTEQLAAISGRDPGAHHADVAQEAASLVAAVIDSDGRHSDGELEAYRSVLGPLLDPPLAVTVAYLRTSDLIAGRASWLRQPSVLADLFMRSDARASERRSHVYYDHALALAHAVAAIDLVTSPGEIEAIDTFRRMLLSAMDRAGLTRPGRTMGRHPTSHRPHHRPPGASPPRAGRIRSRPRSPPHPRRWTTCWPSSTSWSGCGW